MGNGSRAHIETRSNHTPFSLHACLVLSERKDDETNPQTCELVCVGGSDGFGTVPTDRLGLASTVVRLVSILSQLVRI